MQSEKSRWLPPPTYAATIAETARSSHYAGIQVKGSKNTLNRIDECQIARGKGGMILLYEDKGRRSETAHGGSEGGRKVVVFFCVCVVVSVSLRALSGATCWQSKHNPFFFGKVTLLLYLFQPRMSAVIFLAVLLLVVLSMASGFSLGTSSRGVQVRKVMLLHLWSDMHRDSICCSIS